MIRQTHTYVTLDIPPEWHDHIGRQLIAAGYQHAINKEGEIDMHGIALTRGQGVEREPNFVGLLMSGRPESIEVVGPFSTLREAREKLSGFMGHWVCIQSIGPVPSRFEPREHGCVTIGSILKEKK